MQFEFDYFDRAGIERFEFLKIPKAFFTDKDFAKLSSDSKLLYSLLLDRTSLSLKNNWLDEEGRVYIIFTVEAIEKTFMCSHPTASKMLKSLEQTGLIEKKVPGFGKPYRIYVKDFSSKYKHEPDGGRSSRIPDNIFDNPEEGDGAQKPVEIAETRINTEDSPTLKNLTSRSKNFERRDVKNFNDERLKNLTPRSKEFLPVDVKEFYPNKTNIYNHTELNHTEYQSDSSYPEGADAIDAMAHYRKAVQDKIGYEYLVQAKPQRREQIDEIVDLIVDVMMTSPNGYMRIGGQDKPTAIVQKKFSELTYDHIEYVLDSLDNTSSEIGNIRAYLLTSLYNATMSISNYYDRKVAHDMLHDTSHDMYDELALRAEAKALEDVPKQMTL